MAQNRLIGFLDSKSFKPVLSLRTTSGKQFHATLDTGFNGRLFMGWISAEKLDVILTGETTLISLADGTPRMIELGWLDIVWFGNRQTTPVYVLGQGTVPSWRGELEVLVGTRLMHPDLLQINFSTQKVSLTKNHLKPI